MSGPLAVYVHIPFCPTKCGYCDFNSYAMSGEIVGRTVAAIVKEIRQSPLAGRQAKTVFFGGGTPTMLAASQLAEILGAVRDTHPFLPDCEVTSEANPGTVDSEKFESMRKAGFNRLSLGAQSFDTSDLIKLGRIHGPSEIGLAIERARRAGFENINIDLMFGLPGQSLRGWQNNLDLALAAGTDHLSLYGLTIEPNTRFYRHSLRGYLDIAQEDVQREMYDLACEKCDQAGLLQYEISNFSKPGKECRHNLCYWHGEEYAGYGPGAVGAAESDSRFLRSTNAKHPREYCERVETGTPLSVESEELDSQTRTTEKIMLGLRLNEGLPLVGLKMDQEGLREGVGRGWLEVEGQKVRLTSEGRHFCSEATVLLFPC